MSLRLGEVLNHPDFRLELIVGGEDALSTPVAGLHCLEVLDPTPWLEEGWIMLTVGAQIQEGAWVQRALVRHLDEGGMAALGLGLGLYVHEVPRALIEEAEERNFPLFVSPYETPFRDIARYVNQSLLSHDLHVLHRLSSMRQYLLDALHEPGPEAAIVEQLARLTDAHAVAYIDLSGEALATAGRSVEWPSTPELHDLGDSVSEIEVAGHPALGTSVIEGKAPGGWLLLVARAHPFDSRLTKPLVSTAVNLLALVSAARAGTLPLAHDSQRRAAARALRVARGEQDPGVLAALAREGLDFTEPCRLALGAVRESANGGPPASAPVAAFDSFVVASEINAVTIAENDRALLLAQDGLEDLETWIRTNEPSLACGISGPLERVDHLPSALEEAQLALAATLVAAKAAETVRRYEELSPEILLVGSETDAQEARSRLEEVLEPFAGEPRLLDAIEAYYAAEFDMGRAAAELHLHRNSLRNRLMRAEELLGQPLKSSSTISTLHLALLARNVHDAPQSDPPTA